MDKKKDKLTMNTTSRIFIAALFLFGGLTNGFAYKATYNLKVGDQFTVYTTYHNYTYAVLWTYDYSIVEPVSYIGSASTSVTFKCIAPTPDIGLIIQAETYYYKNGTTSSGINRDVDDWKVIIKKDNSSSNVNVRLNPTSKTLSPGEHFTLTATPSSSSYFGKFNWRSSNPCVVFSGSGNSIYATAMSTGYSTITVTLDNGNYAECYVTVRSAAVNSANVSPTSATIDIDATKTLSLSISPSNATISSKSWYSTNTAVATVSSSGIVKGISEGTSEIYCIINGNVTSSKCSVTVTKPNFTLNLTVPTNNAIGQSIEVQPSATFCRTIYQGTAFSKISLKNHIGQTVKGNCNINGSTLTFVPTKSLQRNTAYTLYIPDNAVKDKYDSYNSFFTLSFKTGTSLNVSDAIASENSNIKIWVNNHILYVKGLNIGDVVDIYNINGILIDRFAIESDYVTRPFNSKGVFVIKAGNTTKKILNR